MPMRMFSMPMSAFGFAFCKGWHGSPLRRGLPAEPLARSRARCKGVIGTATRTEMPTTMALGARSGVRAARRKVEREANSFSVVQNGREITERRGHTTADAAIAPVGPRHGLRCTLLAVALAAFATLATAPAGLVLQQVVILALVGIALLRGLLQLPLQLLEGLGLLGEAGGGAGR